VEVYATGPRQARNVILFIGDGMSAAHRTAARILSKGLVEGRYRGGLAMDAMPHMALLGTAGVDSIITDSANSASAFVTMFHDSGVDVLMGGGAAHFLPRSSPGSRRKDDVDYVAKFRAGGYMVVTSDREMKAASGDPATRKLLGLFHPGNMDGVLDRKFLRKGTVERYPEPPDLVDMVRSALAVLSRHDGGFVLMVESGLIDKYSHPLDWERAVMDTIMLGDLELFVPASATIRSDSSTMPTARPRT
jgi:alkaline phosphatase